jgi:hypothetical protein
MFIELVELIVRLALLTGAGAVSASRASFEALEIPRTKRRRPTLNAFSAIEVLVPYTSWRSTRISASFRPSDRPNSTSQPNSRFMIKYSRRADTKAHPPAPAEAQSVRSRHRSPFWRGTGEVKHLQRPRSHGC